MGGCLHAGSGHSACRPSTAPRVSADPLGCALLALSAVCGRVLVESDDAGPPLLRALAAPRQRQGIIVLKVVVELDIKGPVDLLERASMRPITHDTGAAQPHPSA